MLPAGRVVALAAGAPATTVTLSPVASASGVRALRLTDGTGAEYWVELRLPSGRDDWLGTSRDVFGLGAGVLLRQTGSGQHTSLLLDTTPSPAAGWSSDSRVALRTPGEGVVFAGGRFRLELTRLTTTAADIRVTEPAAAPPAPHPVEALHQALGGDAGPVGPARAGLYCGLPAGGCSRAYAHAVISWSPGSGAHVVLGAIGQRWAQQGWETGRLGYPVGDEACGLRDGGCFQSFQGGAVYWSPASGPHVVLGSIGQRWGQQGWTAGRLRLPGRQRGLRSPRRRLLPAVPGRAVYWSPAAGAHVVLGAIGQRWAQQGWESGRLGYPVGSEVCGLRDGGCFQPFQGGPVYWSPGSGAHVVLGAIGQRWAQQGWESGRLGYPVGGEVCGLRDGGCFQPFQGGSLYWSPGSGAQVVLGAIGVRWAQQGWESGSLGYPVGGEVCGLRDGGCFQPFQGGAVYWSPASGAHPVGGIGAALHGAWGGQGWESGRLGYPVEGPRIAARRGVVVEQRFQGGLMAVDSRGRVSVR